MTRKVYVWLFMAMAVAFVPVIFYLGFFLITVPAFWGIARAGQELLERFRPPRWRLRWRIPLVYLLHLSVYLSTFYGLARFTFWLSSVPSRRSVQILIQVTALVALFSCSFLRVLTYMSWDGRGGTYHFWSAVERFFHQADR